MKVILCIALFFVGSSYSWSQRFSFGVGIGTNVFYQTKFKSNTISSVNSYYTYYTQNEKKEDQPIFNQYFNNIQGGTNLSVDYKRFKFTNELFLSSTGIRVPLYYPSYLGSLLDEQWNTFEIRNYAFRINNYISIKLFSRANSPYFFAGFQYAFNSYSEDQGDLNSDVGLSLSLNISSNELYTHIYNNNRHIPSFLFGAGLQVENATCDIRFTQRIDPLTNRPSAKTTQIEIVLTKNLVFQKLKKGPKIYLEER